MREFHKIFQSDLATADIQVLWDEFVIKLQQAIDTYIPMRKAGSRNGLPWVNQEIRRVSERAFEKYIGAILGLTQETDDLDTTPKFNTKNTYTPCLRTLSRIPEAYRL